MKAVERLGLDLNPAKLFSILRGPSSKAGERACHQPPPKSQQFPILGNKKAFSNMKRNTENTSTFKLSLNLQIYQLLPIIYVGIYRFFPLQNRHFARFFSHTFPRVVKKTCRACPSLSWIQRHGRGIKMGNGRSHKNPLYLTNTSIFF